MTISKLDKLLSRCSREEIIYISKQLKKMDTSRRKRYYKLFNELRNNPKLKVSSDHKKYLFRMIIRVLLNYNKPLHSTPSPRENLEIARVLYEKQLLEPAYKLLMKCLPKLEESQDWSLIVEYTELLIRLIRLLDFDNLEKLRYFIELQEKAINIMLYQNKYNYLSSLVGNTFHREGFSRIPEVKKKIQDILASQELQELPPYNDILVIAQYYNINGISYAFIGEYEKSSTYFKEMLEKLEELYTGDIRAEKLKLITYVNLTNNYLSLGKHSELKKHIKNFIQTIETYPQFVNTHIFTGFLSVFITANIKMTSDVQLFKELADTTYKNFNKFKEHEFVKTYKELIFVLATGYFILKEYGKARKILREFDKMNVPKRRDLVLLSDLLRLLIEYEDKDINYLEHLLRRFYYKLRKHPQENFPLENVILQAISSLLRQPISKHKDIYVDTLKLLNKIYEEHPEQKSYLLLIPIEEWLKGQIYNKDFRTLLKANDKELETQMVKVIKLINNSLT